MYSPMQTLMSVHLVNMHACSIARTHQGGTAATAILDMSYKTMAMTVKVSVYMTNVSQHCTSLHGSAKVSQIQVPPAMPKHSVPLVY